MTKVNNLKTKLDINYAPMEKPFGASDQSSFAKKGVPVAWFFIGSHKDYHQISDTARKNKLGKNAAYYQIRFFKFVAICQRRKNSDPLKISVEFVL